MTPIEASTLARDCLSDERFAHTRSVAECARELARTHRFDPVEAELAGWLHDILKERPKDDLLQMMRSSDIIKFGDIEGFPALWHAFAGGEYVERELGLGCALGDAVRYHTTGRPNMTELDKLTFLADYCSVDRQFRGVDEVRELAKSNLDAALQASLRNQICHLAKMGRPINMYSVSAFNQLVKDGSLLRDE